MAHFVKNRAAVAMPLRTGRSSAARAPFVPAPMASINPLAA